MIRTSLLPYDTDDMPMAISDNNHFIVQDGDALFACRLNAREIVFMCSLLDAVTIDGNDVGRFGVRIDDRDIRSFVRAINRKLGAKRMPVYVSFSAWALSLRRTPSSPPLLRKTGGFSGSIINRGARCEYTPGSIECFVTAGDGRRSFG